MLTPEPHLHSEHCNKDMETSIFWIYFILQKEKKRKEKGSWIEIFVDMESQTAFKIFLYHLTPEIYKKKKKE